MAAEAPPAKYYMASRQYNSISFPPPPFDNTTTRGVVEYASAPASSRPTMPLMPPFNDTATAHRFYSNLTSLLRPGRPTVPLHVDTSMFVTFGLGRTTCQPGQLLCNRTQGAVAASMNNVSFAFPTEMSLLEAHFNNVKGIYTRDFPDKPPVFFDFTNPAAKKLKYNSTVEMVLQNTAILAAESHPMHLHGYDFYVLAQGFGNYDNAKARECFNLVDPQKRNTIAVPTGGWAVIRFTADNPDRIHVYEHAMSKHEHYRCEQPNARSNTCGSRGHGIFQLLSGWADGANLITQCPIRSGSSYTYKFKVVGQEGTLWWHAHSSFLRATVYGALIIRPRLGPLAYPFDKPYREIPIILGEWWKEDVIKVEKDAYLAGNVPIKSDAFTINGMPGDLYPCPNTYKLKVEYGETYMLRIINAALNSHLFFKVAGHFFTVVAVDASYTEPCVTDTIVIAPGQTVDALMETNATPADTTWPLACTSS
uniref:laccase n=1 Tax=Ananas comosus var. bracteatus TaxID=296719 RepID=A0A6V7QU97_ANACO